MFCAFVGVFTNKTGIALDRLLIKRPINGGNVGRPIKASTPMRDRFIRFLTDLFVGWIIKSGLSPKDYGLKYVVAGGLSIAQTRQSLARWRMQQRREGVRMK